MMKLRPTLVRSLYLVFFALALSPILRAQSSASPQQMTGTDGSVRFTENRGQIVDAAGELRPDLLYTADSRNVKIFFRRDGISYVFVKTESDAPLLGGSAQPHSRPFPEGPGRPGYLDHPANDKSLRTSLYRVDMDLIGANPEARVEGDDVADSYTNYYYDHCPQGITNVRDFRKVVYRDIYPKIDLVFYGHAGGLKYDFVVRPGGRVSDIRMRYTGIDSARIRDGRVDIFNPFGKLEEGKPFTYQSSGPGGSKGMEMRLARPLRSGYVLHGEEIGFTVDGYDASRPLVIDPTLFVCSYYGGSSYEYGWGWGGWWGGWGGWSNGGSCRTDRDGNIFISGSTASVDFPTTAGAFQTVKAGTWDTDGFVVKLTVNGHRIWATYFGGSSSDFFAGNTTDKEKNVILCGSTSSPNLPVTSGTYKVTGVNYWYDGFIAKFDSNGARVWATFHNNSYPNGIAADSSSNVIIGGNAGNVMVTTPGAYKSTPPPATAGTGFVAKYSATGTLIWSTYFGGTPGVSWASVDGVSAVASDVNEDVIFAGTATAADFPTTDGTALFDQSEAFIAKFDPNGNLKLSTIFGGSEFDYGSDVAVDNASNIVLTGTTSSNNLPTTPTSFQPTFKGTQYDLFIAKFGGDGSRIWTTYYGGSGWEYGGGMDIDAHGNIWVVGYAYSWDNVDFPVTADAFQSTMTGGMAGFILKFDGNGGRKWATFFGGSAGEYIEGVATNFLGCVIAGSTWSTDLPVTQNVFQSTNAGSYDEFIAQFCDPVVDVKIGGPTTVCAGDSVVLTAPYGFETYAWSNGANTQRVVIKTSGNYTVTGTNRGCTGTSLPIPIIVHPATRHSIRSTTGSYDLCEGDSTMLILTGGARNYFWSNGGITPSIRVKTAGNYYARYIDSNGCEKYSDTVTVNVYPRPVVTLTPSGPTTFCEGESVRLDLVGAGHTEYKWSTGEATSSLLVTRSGSYWGQAKNIHGCWSKPQTIQVKVHPKPTVEINMLLPTVFCEGDSTIAVATPGYKKYEWSNGDSTHIVTLREAGIYTVTATDSNGCQGKANVTIKVTPRPVATISASGPTTFCEGDSVILTASGGSQFQWSNGWQDRSILVKEPGKYYVIVSNEQGCSGTSEIIDVKVLERPRAEISGPGAVCKEAEATYSATAGSDLTYAWEVSGGGGSIVGAASTGSVTVLWGPSGTGTVTLRVKNTATGCEADTSIDVTIGTALRPVVTHTGSLQLCPGQSTTLDAGSYASYQWSTGEQTRTITVSTPGSYTVSVVDAKGCSGTSDPIVVTEQPNPTPVISMPNNGEFCEGGSIVLDAGDGYRKYLWSNGSTTQRITVTQGGTYTVTVTDASGCSGASEEVEVRAQAKPSPQIRGPKVVCRNSTISYSVPETVGSSYTWSVSGGTIMSGQGTSTIMIQWGAGGTGSADVVETTLLGCNGASPSYPVTIGDKLEPVITPSGTVAICEGAAVTLDAGDGFASYQWSPGGETTRTITVTSPGSYSVTVADDNGCSGTSAAAEVVIGSRPIPVVVPSGPVALCPGDSVTLSVSGSYASYRWTRDGVQLSATTPSIIARQTGSYRVTVRTSEGCEGESAPVAVTLHPGATKPAITAKDALLESSDAATYQWSFNGVAITGATTKQLQTIGEGEYRVRITDANGCAATSNPYHYRGARRSFSVMLDTLSVRVGERGKLVMRVDPALDSSDQINGYRAVLRVNPDAIFIHEAISPDRAVTGDAARLKVASNGMVTVERAAGSPILTGAELFSLDLEGLATGTPLNVVSIEEVELFGAPKTVLMGQGLVILSGCEVGLSFGKRVRIERIMPNPIYEGAVLEYRAPAGSVPELRLLDANGNERRVRRLEIGTGETQAVQLDLDEESSGMYMLELRDGAERVVLPIVIQK